MDVIFPIKRPSDLAVWLHQSLLYMLTLIPLYSSLKQVQRTSDDPNSNIVAINYSESDPEDNNKETHSENSTSEDEEIEYYRENPAYSIYSK